MLPKFELIEPKTLSEALEVLARRGDTVAPIAGGTNLLPDLRGRRPVGAVYLNIARLNELRFMRGDQDTVTIGGGTTVNDLLRSEDIRRSAPGLHASAKAFAGQMIRNAATVAGNLCYGSPSADLVPPLLTLDAAVTLASADGERQVPLAEFGLDYKKTARRPNELLTAVSWPRPDRGAANAFYKLGLRKGDAITVVGVAVGLRLVDGNCQQVRIALGSVAPTVFRATEAEDLMMSRPPSAELIDRAARAAAAASRPIDDIRASKEYRLHATRVLVRRLLTEAVEGLSGRPLRADVA